MELIYESKYKISDLGDKKIHYKAWSAKEQQNYLALIEEQKILDENTLYETLIKPVIKEKDEVLTLAQIKKLMFDIRVISISDFIEDNYTCEKCGKEHNIKVQISKNLKYKPTSFKNNIIDDIEILFKEPTSNKELKELEIEKGIVQYIFNDFLRYIDTIKYKDKVHTNLTQKTKKEFINSLPSNIFDKIMEIYTEQADDVSLDYNFKCECGNEEILDYTLTPNLLWV